MQSSEVIVKHKNYEVKVLEGHVGYFRFSEMEGLASYSEGYKRFMKLIQQTRVTSMIVHVTDLKQLWSKNNQQGWIDAGDNAEQSGIEKWGVICDNPGKVLTIRHVVSGGKHKKRNYQSLVTISETDCLSWIGLPTDALARKIDPSALSNVSSKL